MAKKKSNPPKSIPAAIVPSPQPAPPAPGMMVTIETDSRDIGEDCIFVTKVTFDIVNGINVFLENPDDKKKVLEVWKWWAAYLIRHLSGKRTSFSSIPKLSPDQEKLVPSCLHQAAILICNHVQPGNTIPARFINRFSKLRANPDSGREELLSLYNRVLESFDNFAATPAPPPPPPAPDASGGLDPSETPIEKIELDAEGMRVLNAVAESPSAIVQADLEAATHLTRKTIKIRLDTLRELGLIHRPRGKRGGEAITQKGLNYLAYLHKRKKRKGR